VPKSSGTGGFLLYTLAQKQCKNFGTCLKTGDDVGMANVNSKIFQKFHEGKQNLLLGNCEKVRPIVERITQLMTVPFIQDTIHYAFEMEKLNDKRETEQGKAAAVAAAVLPILNDCNETDADIVYDNMRVGNGGNANFAKVKAAFERNYQCMGITCDLVGGIVNVSSGEFLEGAEPCVHQKPEVVATADTADATADTTAVTSAVGSGSGGPNVGMAVGLTLGILAAVVVVFVSTRKPNEKEFDGAADQGIDGRMDGEENTMSTIEWQ
jgi:hypothetical protein